MNKIRGAARRLKKKELSRLQSCVKLFWHFEDLDRIYGGGLPDDECEKLLQKMENKMEKLKEELSEEEDS